MAHKCFWPVLLEPWVWLLKAEKESASESQNEMVPPTPNS
jgi:hypothetical protein